MLKNIRYDLVAFFGLLLFVSFFAYLFWNLPIHEDNGYYAFLSKAMANGAILHKDIPAQTNGLILYLVAFLFHFTGPDIHIYKGIHLLFHFGLGWTIYLLMKDYFRKSYAFAIALLVLIFLGLPSIAFDIGRNPIECSLFFIFLGIYFFHKRENIFLFAFFLGIAALIRETFLIVPLIVLVVYIKKYIQFERIKIYHFVFGLFCALSINAFLLTYYDSWSGYFTDMLHSGAQFRYAQGFFSLSRIQENFKMMLYGYSNYPLLVFSLPIVLTLFVYKIDVRDKTIDFLKYLLLPVFILEAVGINKTADYSIFPIVAVSTILAAFVVKRIINHRFIFKLLVIVMIVFMGNILEIYYKYYSYAVDVTSGKMTNVDPNRLVEVIDAIPHSTITAFSEYPALFLSKVSYRVTYPYMVDFSAPFNLGRPQMRIDQLKKLSQDPTDVYIDKTTDWYLSKEDEWGKILDSNYYKVADFRINHEDKFFWYKERIMIRKNLINNYPESSKMKIVESKSSLKIENNRNQIVAITSDDNCRNNLSLINQDSEINYSPKETNQSELFSFVKKNTNLLIVNHGKQNCNIIVKIFNFIGEEN